MWNPCPRGFVSLFLLATVPCVLHAYEFSVLYLKLMFVYWTGSINCCFITAKILVRWVLTWKLLSSIPQRFSKYLSYSVICCNSCSCSHSPHSCLWLINFLTINMAGSVGTTDKGLLHLFKIFFINTRCAWIVIRTHAGSFCMRFFSPCMNGMYSWQDFPILCMDFPLEHSQFCCVKCVNTEFLGWRCHVWRWPACVVIFLNMPPPPSLPPSNIYQVLNRLNWRGHFKTFCILRLLYKIICLFAYKNLEKNILFSSLYVIPIYSQIFNCM